MLLIGDVGQLIMNRYLGSGVAESSGAVFRVGSLAVTAFYFGWSLRRKWKNTHQKDYSFICLGAIAMLLTLLLIPISSTISDRIGYYLVPVQAMIFARVPYLPFRMNRILHKSIPYFFLLLLFFVWTYYSYHFQECYLPYQSWIFGFPNGNETGL